MLESGAEGLDNEEEVVEPQDVKCNNDSGKERGLVFLHLHLPDVGSLEC